MKDSKKVCLQVGDEIEYQPGRAGRGLGTGACQAKMARIIGFTGDGVLLAQDVRTKSLTPGVPYGAILAIRRQVNGQAQEIFRRAS